MNTGSVEIPTVNVAGTLTRMLFRDRAPDRGMSITMGSRGRNAKSWSRGMMNFAAAVNA